MTRKQREDALLTVHSILCIAVDDGFPEPVIRDLKLAEAVMESLLHGDELNWLPVPYRTYGDRRPDRLRKRIRNLADKVAKREMTRADHVFLVALDDAVDRSWEPEAEKEDA